MILHIFIKQNNVAARQGVSVVTQPVYLLDRLARSASNLTQKLFESPAIVPRTITCRTTRKQKTLQRECFLTSWLSGTKLELFILENTSLDEAFEIKNIDLVLLLAQNQHHLV